MISSAFRVLFFSILSLAAGWGSVAMSGESGLSILAGEERRFRAAYPSERSLPRPAADRCGSGDSLFGRFFPGLTDGFGFIRFVSIVQGRLHVASAVLPLFLLAFSAGWLLGSVLRERIRFGLTYASPLVSFVSKRTAEVSLLYFILWSFTPVGLPFW